MNLKQSILAFSLLLSSSFIFAQGTDTPWKIDKAHTAITFTVPHLMISEVTGAFKDYEIQVTAAKADFTDLKINASIKTNSINTDNSQRDEHLKSDDFFNSATYPDIKFVSTSVKKIDAKNYKIVGNLTIRDITKSVTFNAIYNGSIKNPWGNTVTVWKASTSINRMDYNLKWNKALETGGMTVGEIVSVNMVIEMTK
ncbi:MAG: YceI family protein [Bacteroidota bacterium]